MMKTAGLGLTMVLLIITGACSTGLIQQAESDYRAEDYQGAARLLTRYLASHPGSHNTQRKLGITLYKAGLYREAVSRLKLVIDQRPHDSFARLYLGMSHLHLDNYPEALAVWEQYQDDGRPLIIRELRRQINRIGDPTQKKTARRLKLAAQVTAVIEEAINAERLREAYNIARIGDCA